MCDSEEEIDHNIYRPGRAIIMPRNVGKSAYKIPNTKAGTPIRMPQPTRCLSPRSAIRKPIMPVLSRSKTRSITPCSSLPRINPWLKESDQVSDSEHSLSVTIAGVTPFGTIARVPTLVGNISYERGQARPMEQEDVSDEDDPLFSTDIYLDLTKQEDRDYNYVSKRMQEISSAVQQNSRNTRLVRLLEVPYQVRGAVDKETFRSMLNIYENNQVFYQDSMDDETMDHDKICNCLRELEKWFVNVHRVGSRGNQGTIPGISKYCDPDIFQYLE